MRGYFLRAFCFLFYRFEKQFVWFSHQIFTAFLDVFLHFPDALNEQNFVKFWNFIRLCFFSIWHDLQLQKLDFYVLRVWKFVHGFLCIIITSSINNISEFSMSPPLLDFKNCIIIHVSHVVIPHVLIFLYVLDWFELFLLVEQNLTVVENARVFVVWIKWIIWRRSFVIWVWLFT